MACSLSTPDRAFDPCPEAGFATPAAVVISLALAMVAVAVQVRAVAALHASQADYVRAVAELRLQGAQVQAAADLAAGVSVQDGGWRLASDQGPIDVHAEPEGTKLGYASAAGLDPQVLSTLGASRPAVVQAGLAELAARGEGDPERLAALDPSPLWRACAGRSLSAYGQALALGTSPPAQAYQAHAGEVWRVMVRDGWGWTDARIVRYTGDAGAPDRVIYRDFKRDRSGAPRCPLEQPPHAPA